MVVYSQILCTTYFLHLFGEQYAVSFLPKGDCFYCCKIDIFNDIKLYAFTKSNPNLPILLSWERYKDNAVIFNGSITNIFYVHGFSEYYNSVASVALKDALMKLGNVVVVVDWSPLSAVPWYDTAVRNMETVGQAVGSWIDSMCSAGLSLKTIHVIGFSLGVEVSGYLSHYISTGTIPRITALDPAHGAKTDPSFGRRLTLRDAGFIDVIHTDSKHDGVLTPMGHVDFYPNLGLNQPGCSIKEIYSSGRFWELIACSHNRAWRYFVESTEYPYSFPSIAMGNVKGQKPVEYMGMIVSEKSRGMYYLSTNKVKPYGRGAAAHPLPLYFDPF